MNTHESIRSMLALAAAGALNDEESREVDRHVQTCDDCRREWSSWRVVAAGLKHLPQPVAPADLIARAQARILREREASAAARWSGFTLGALGIYSWVVSLAFWLLARAITDGMFVVLGTNLVSAGPWFLVSFIVSGTTVVTAALALKHHGQFRRTI